MQPVPKKQVMLVWSTNTVFRETDTAVLLKKTAIMAVFLIGEDEVKRGRLLISLLVAPLLRLQPQG